jgi:hypothetical protein
MFVPLLAFLEAATPQAMPTWLQAVSVLTPVGLSIVAAFKAQSLRGQRDRSRTRERHLRTERDNLASPVPVSSEKL